MNVRRITVLGLGIFAASLVACACEDASTTNTPVSIDDDVTEELGSEVTPATASKLNAVYKYPISPARGKTVGVDLDVDLVVKALKKLKTEFYGRADKFTKKRTPSWNKDEPRQCLQACPEFYSDIVCHFYSWHPSYDAVSPNIRGCFTQIARGAFKPTIGKDLFYPQTYDYCTYQPFDAVLNAANTGNKFNQKLIDTNKAAGTKPGVNAWVDDNERDAFKHVMFTYYDRNLYTVESQQEALNAFYGVKLSKPDYTIADKADVAACKKARRRNSLDSRNGVPDGLECSTTKPYPIARHPDFAKIQKFMAAQTDPSLQ